MALAAIFSIATAVHVKNLRGARAQTTTKLTNIQRLLTDAESSLLYKNDARAAELLGQAKEQLPTANAIDSTNQELYKKVLSQFDQTVYKIEKTTQVQTENLGSLAESDNLIKLPQILAVQSGNVTVSYNKQTRKIEDGSLQVPVTFESGAFVKGSAEAVYDGSKLYSWNFLNGKISEGFANSVPQKNDFGGLAAYSDKSRIYVANKQSGAITSFAISESGVAQPIVSVRDSVINKSIDIAIDSNIYVLTSDGVNRFLNGRLTDFFLPKLSQGFSGVKKIYTQKDFAYIYILDAGNNKILIVYKKGGLVKTLVSDKFTKMKDFQIEEKNRTIFILNDGSLLKATY